MVQAMQQAQAMGLQGETESEGEWLSEPEGGATAEVDEQRNRTLPASAYPDYA